MVRHWRRALFAQLDPAARPGGGLSPLNAALCVLILLATALAVAETEPVVTRGRGALFHLLELAFALLFAAEYATRVWTAAERDAARPWRARWGFVRSPAGLVDLTVVVVSLLPMFAANAQMARIFRLFRILSLAKLGRTSAAFRHLTRAVRSRAPELGLTLVLGLALLLAGATALYWIEGEAQPDKFGSIPRSLWWAAITLTTIGYGDVFPITPLGKLVAALVAICGVGLIAMPTGILAAAFSDAMQRTRDEREGYDD